MGRDGVMGVTLKCRLVLSCDGCCPEDWNAWFTTATEAEAYARAEAEGWSFDESRTRAFCSGCTFEMARTARGVG